MEKVGCYIHIPFCQKKCYYCDFCAYMNVENRVEPYIKNLIKEIEWLMPVVTNTGVRKPGKKRVIKITPSPYWLNFFCTF